MKLLNEYERILVDLPNIVQSESGTVNGVSKFRPGVPVNDRIYLRACRRCGGAVRFRRLIDSEYELLCLSCGRSYQGRPPEYIAGVQIALTNELRAIRWKKLESTRTPVSRRITRTAIYNLLDHIPDIRPSRLAELVGISERAAFYWKERHQRRTDSGLNREKTGSD